MEEVVLSRVLLTTRRIRVQFQAFSWADMSVRYEALNMASCPLRSGISIC